MKHSLKFLSLAAATALTLSACGGEASPDSQPHTSSTTTAAAEPSPAMEPGTRESPLPAGTVVQISGTDWDENLVSAADIEIGQANWVADDLLAAEDYTPEEGNIFVLVPVTVTLTESADSVTVEPASTIWVSYVSPDGQSFDGFVNPLGDALESQPELYPGASATGTLAFEIPADATGGLWAVQDVMQSIAPVYVMAE